MPAGRILVAEHSGDYIMKFVGDVRCTLCPSVDDFIAQMIGMPGFHSVFIDLSEAENLDSTTLGMIAKTGILARRLHAQAPTILCNSTSIIRLLDTMGLTDVFDIRQERIPADEQMRELPEGELDEVKLQQKVIEAHKVLMSLNERNRLEFKDLMDILEAGQGQSH